MRHGSRMARIGGSTATTVSLAFAFVALALLPRPAAAIQLGEIAPAGVSDTGNEVSYLQRSSSGQPSYVAPAAGTITSFAFRSGNNHDPGDFIRLLVLRPLGGSSYSVVGTSDPVMLSGHPLQARLGFPVVIAARPGDVIGAQYKFNGTGDGPIKFSTSSAGDAIDQISTFPIPAAGGTVEASDAGANQRLNMEVSFEYADTFAPEITAFKALYKSFRYNRKGAVISNRAHPGTTISLNLSEPATVTFTVEKGFRGVSVGGVCVRPTSKNKNARPCTRWVFVHQFTRTLATGPNAFGYSARYVSPNNGKTGTLRPGPYRMRADAVDSVGNAGSGEPLRFKLRK